MFQYFRYSYTARPFRSDEVLKFKNFKKDEYTSFQDQEKYEHVGLKITSTQDGKRSQDDDKRLYSAHDLKKLKYHMQVKLKGTSSSLKSKDHYEVSPTLCGYEPVRIRYRESGIGDSIPLHDYILWFGSGDMFRPNGERYEDTEVCDSLPFYACSDSLLLTPLCCDDIHDVTPRVSALAGCDRLVSEPLVIENHVSSISLQLLRSFSRAKFHWGIASATWNQAFTDPETRLKMKHTNRRVRIPKGLHPRRIEEKNEFAPHQLPQREGNMNGWLMEDEDEPLEHEASDKEVDSDLESTASSKPK
ncbi:hypothetical protein Tco_1044569 [Tanacetum coccineum]|uniref:Uncharacterized protein n=1 Tax=Tanacetum coccineum TaxID=301880 RepID=A0ABQ5GQV2_9ASTR